MQVLVLFVSLVATVVVVFVALVLWVMLKPGYDWPLGSTPESQLGAVLWIASIGSAGVLWLVAVGVGALLGWL